MGFDSDNPWRIDESGENYDYDYGLFVFTFRLPKLMVFVRLSNVSCATNVLSIDLE